MNLDAYMQMHLPLEAPKRIQLWLHVCVCGAVALLWLKLIAENGSVNVSRWQIEFVVHRNRASHTHTPSPHRDYWHIFLLAASPSPTTIDRAAERAQFSSFGEAKKRVERKLIEQITYAYWIAICDTSNSDRRIHFCWKVRAERFGWTLVQCVRDLLLIFLNRGKTSLKMKRLNGKIQNEKR